MSGNLTVTYQEDTNATSDNLSTILTGFSGAMTMVGELSSQYGDLAGKKFSAIFTVLNGTIAGITQYGDSDLSNEELEKAAVGTLAGYLIGGGAVVVLASVGLPATAIVLGAGATAIGVGLAGNLIYEKYEYIQQKVFTYLIENELHPVSSSAEITSIEYYQDGFGTIKRFEENMDITATVTYEQLLDSTIFDKVDDNNSSWNIIETNTSEQLAYNKHTLEAIVNTSTPITSESTPKALEYVFNETQADKLTLNNQTYDIKDLSPIQLRNAIEGIDSVSFLLSNILIKVGEKLDLGDKGVYIVKSGDTLSVIAQDNGTITKELVKLNPWLFDDNRIEFNYPTKVLVAEGTVISDNNDNTLQGEDTENILIDHNGGNDTLIGGSGEDWLEGGEGYDTYIANDLDTIKDSDGSGRIVFEGTILTGAKIEDGETEYYSQEDHGTYYLSSDGFTFVSDTGKTLNVITPLDYSEQVLPDGNGGTMTVKTYTGVGVTLENHILACGNKKQKIESLNNHFHMPWHVEICMKKVG